MLRSTDDINDPNHVNDTYDDPLVLDSFYLSAAHPVPTNSLSHMSRITTPSTSADPVFAKPLPRLYRLLRD